MRKYVPVMVAVIPVLTAILNPGFVAMYPQISALVGTVIAVFTALANSPLAQK